MLLEIKNMTQKEKLQAMEMLWDDLCRTMPDFQSPQWHKDILFEREIDLVDGKDNPKDFERVKKELRDKTR